MRLALYSTCVPLIGVIALLNACAGMPQSTGPTEQPAEAVGKAESLDSTTASNSGSSVAIAAALDAQLATGARSPGMEIEVDCSTEKGRRAVTIFEDGSAIWSEQRQFALSPAEMHEVLEYFRRFEFASMPDMFGGKPEQEKDDTPPSMQGEDEGADKNDKAERARVICRARLQIDGLSKQVNQVHLGEQSAELRGLADAVLDLCEDRGQAGLLAENLDDGLAKIISGQLSPHALNLMTFRGIDGSPAERADEGWVMQMHGSRATSRTYTRAGYGVPVTLELRPAELVALINALRENQIDDWPGNLFAQQYTDLIVSVMDKKKKTIARQFARMTPATHGAKQRQFDEVFKMLDALHERVVAEGQ